MTYEQNSLGNFLQVSIVVNALTNKYYFPDLPQLRDAKIMAMSFYPKLSATQYHKDPNGVGTMLISDAVASYLTLSSGDYNVIERLPLLKLKNLWYDDEANNAEYRAVGNNEGLFTIDGKVIDFSKSYVEVAPNFALTTPLNFAISFGVWYIK